MSALDSKHSKAKPQPRKPLHGEWLLLLTSVLWGSGFIAQRQAMLVFKPFTYISIRFLIGGSIVLTFLLLQKKQPSAEPTAIPKSDKKMLILGIVACGLALCTGTALQQIGLVTTSAGKAGFITALYMVFVPILSFLLGKKVRLRVWAAVLLAALGLYFLSIKSGFSIEKGDLIIFIGSIVWACHILLIDHFSARVDGLKLACGQFFVTSIIAGLIAIFIEGWQAPAISLPWWTAIYSGVAVVGIAFTLQVIGQQTVKPAVGALILSLEAVFALFFGVLLLHERLTSRELLGCALVAAAVLLVQLRFPSRAPSSAQK